MGGSGSGATGLSTYACALAWSVMEPKSHRLLPKHLPLHTEVTWEEPVYLFTPQMHKCSLGSLNV